MEGNCTIEGYFLEVRYTGPGQLYLFNNVVTEEWTKFLTNDDVYNRSGISYLFNFNIEANMLTHVSAETLRWWLYKYVALNTAKDVEKFNVRMVKKTINIAYTVTD